jgi:hypothetical protein
MVPPLNCSYCFSIGYTLIYYNTLIVMVPALKNEQPIHLHHYNYLCWLTLMIWYCLLPPLRSYRLYYIVSLPFVLPTH